MGGIWQLAIGILPLPGTTLLGRSWIGTIGRPRRSARLVSEGHRWWHQSNIQCKCKSDYRGQQIIIIVFRPRRSFLPLMLAILSSRHHKGRPSYKMRHTKLLQSGRRLGATMITMIGLVVTCLYCTTHWTHGSCGDSDIPLSFAR